ncbi:hypothetical protein BDZ89DRAFT_1140438 [Hymenopellis radicata]|nr:hypothetical protein BDZ89DRAFT_1140438 [Hymenopellis radicata]
MPMPDALVPESTDAFDLRRRLLDFETAVLLQGSEDVDYWSRIDPQERLSAIQRRAWRLRPGEEWATWRTRQRQALSAQNWRQKLPPEKRKCMNEKSTERMQRSRARRRKRDESTKSQNSSPSCSGGGGVSEQVSGDSTAPPGCVIIDLREDIPFERDFDVLALKGKHTTVVAYGPWIDAENGENLLHREAKLVKILSEKAGGLTDESNAHVTVLDHVDADCQDVVRRALGAGKVVYVPPSADQVAHHLDAQWIKRNYAVNTSDRIREFIVSMKSKARMYEPGAPDGLTQYHSEEVSLEDLLKPLTAESDRLFCLEFAAFVRSLPEGLFALDDTLAAWQETKFMSSLFTNRVDMQQFVDRFWGLLHQGMTNTTLHHDADGKVTIILGQAGYKIWFVVYPAGEVGGTPEEVARFQESLVEDEDEGRYPDNISVYAFLIAPGAILMQPPGLMHAVYTPVPAYVNGCSFWSLDSLHLTRISRVVDVNLGNSLTNVDHDDVATYESFLRLICHVPIVQDRELPKSALIALCSMVMFPDQFYMRHRRHDNMQLNGLQRVTKEVQALPARRLAVTLACILCESLGFEVEMKVMVENDLKRTKAGKYREKKVEALSCALRRALDSEGELEGELIDLGKGGIRRKMRDAIDRARGVAVE